MRALLDTNVLIDFLNNVPEARAEIHLHRQRSISIITWIEVMAGTPPAQEAATRSFLSGFDLAPLTPEIAERAVELRRARRIKVPDAIIWASAQTHSMLLVTRNIKDFPATEPGIRIPYQLR